MQFWDASSGKHIFTTETDELVDKLYFLSDGSALHSNIGEIDLPLKLRESSNHDSRLAIFSISDDWIYMNSRKGLLWFPTEFRDLPYDIREHVIVFGHDSGRVTFLEIEEGQL